MNQESKSSAPGRNAIDPRDPVIVCAADDRYAMALAVSLISAVTHLTAERRITCFLLDDGISSLNKDRLTETIASHPIDFNWIEPSLTNCSELPVSRHVSRTTYFRLLLDEYLPDKIDRILYLDCDLIVLGDLSELWLHKLDGNYCLAAQDIACPYVDARVGSGNYKKSYPYLASVCPVRNYKTLQIPPDSKYLNGGVLLIDLAKWREEELGTRFLKCIRENLRYVWCWDQYALNVVLSGRWGELPMTWNQGAHTYEFPSEEHSPIDRDEFCELRDKPKIVHFTTPDKPWKFGCPHPYTDEFFKLLDRTAWRGWRPEAPRFKSLFYAKRDAVRAGKIAVGVYRGLANLVT